MQNHSAITWNLRKSGGVWVVHPPLVPGFPLMFPVVFDHFDEALKYIVDKV